MPILTANPVEILYPATPYQRLAFRGSLTASLTAGALTKGELALHVTTYRKVGEEIEEVGRPQGVRGTTMALGRDPRDDALLARISTGCVAAVLGAGATATLTCNFNWRPRAGDVVGLVHAVVTPAEGEPVTVACGDVAAWDQDYPQFALAYGDALTALGEWIAAKGW